jgi:hypothetical protein
LFIDLIKLLSVVTFKEMGMKEWLAPQISEHWPVYNPIRLGITNNWLRRPGRASTFTPIEGRAQE